MKYFRLTSLVATRMYNHIVNIHDSSEIPRLPVTSNSGRTIPMNSPINCQMVTLMSTDKPRLILRRVYWWRRALAVTLYRPIVYLWPPTARAVTRLHVHRELFMYLSTIISHLNGQTKVLFGLIHFTSVSAR